mgnify:CR=1 FL=1
MAESLEQMRLMRDARDIVVVRARDDASLGGHTLADVAPKAWDLAGLAAHLEPQIVRGDRLHVAPLTDAFDRMDAAFAAWSTADAVKRWFAPTGFTIPEARVEMRAGGRRALAEDAHQRDRGVQGGQPVHPGIAHHRPPHRRGQVTRCGLGEFGDHFVRGGHCRHRMLALSS